MLGVFRNGDLIERVEPDATIRDNLHRAQEQTDRAYGILQRLADGNAAHGYEVLRICPNHPERSIVDCTDCDPKPEDLTLVESSRPILEGP